MKNLINILAMIAIVLIGGTQYVKAQDGAFAVGVAGDMSSDLLKGDESIQAYGGVELFANYKYKFCSRFFILPEIAFVQRWHRNNRFGGDIIGSYLHGRTSEEIRSISTVFALRPNFGVNIVKNISITTGPEMDWVFAQSHKDKVRDAEDFPQGIIERKNEKKVQWGWNIGALADINKIRLGVNYMIRIGNMMDYSSKPGVLRISVGYRF